jgi:hypothetical protein
MHETFIVRIFELDLDVAEIPHNIVARKPRCRVVAQDDVKGNAFDEIARKSSHGGILQNISSLTLRSPLKS